MMMKCKYIDDYISVLRSGQVSASCELLKACNLVESKLKNPDCFVDTEKTEKAIELMEKYFKMSLFPWEKFVIALIHCFYKSDDTVVFSEFFLMMGRGNGKNGFISAVAWYLSTHYHGAESYNIDIIANSEEQAKTSFNDIYEMLENTWQKSQRFFYKTKEVIRNTKTKSYIKFNSSNASTKDGKRSACLIFDEIHEYQNSDTIKVFRSGFGKRKHSRIFYITTNGYVRDGVLDDKLRIATDVLNGEITGSRMLPLIYKLDNKEEAEDERNWEKANPSLPYLSNLRLEMKQNWIDKEYDDSVKADLYTKRFNLPSTYSDLAVTDYENIKMTNKPLPDLTGWQCICGIDYAELSDWAAVNFHFKNGEQRYDINHAWLCTHSKTLNRIKAPWREWAKAGLVTVVDDVGIHPDLLAEYIQNNMKKYAVKKIALDHYRWTLISESLKKIGFDANDKERVKLVRPFDIMQIEPVIQECFNRNLFSWGDYPPLRWAVNNTKRVRSSRSGGVDTGNFIYAKIEAKSRKTDMFMALVASMVCENELKATGAATLPSLGSFVF